MRSRNESVLSVRMQFLMWRSRELLRLYLRNLTQRKYNRVDFNTDVQKFTNSENKIIHDTEKCALCMREVR
jgi:hypothetical protein